MLEQELVQTDRVGCGAVVERRYEIGQIHGFAFQELGYNISGIIVSKKWANLVATFKNIKDNKKKTGRGTKKWA